MTEATVYESKSSCDLCGALVATAIATTERGAAAESERVALETWGARRVLYTGDGRSRLLCKPCVRAVLESKDRSKGDVVSR